MSHFVLNAELSELVSSSAHLTDHYFCTSKFMQVAKSMAVKSGKAYYQHAMRSLLANLLEINIGRIDGLKYPAAIKQLIRREFHRIRTEVNENPSDDFDVDLYRFRSNLRIACFGRIPVGPEHIEVDGIPRSICCRGGVSQSLRFVQLAARLGAFKPYYVLHFALDIEPAAFLFSYSPSSQEQMFRNLAACMQVDQSIRGVLATSWWYDPQLESVSPYLTYLRIGWVSRGALSFRWGSTKEDVRLATAKCLPRAEAYKKGTYNPTSYTVVWPRQSLLQWALDNAGNLPSREL